MHCQKAVPLGIPNVSMSTATSSAGSTPPPGAVSGSGLRSLSRSQWRSGLAAWLGWLFDGLDMHLYTLVAAPFVMQLLHAATPSDPMVKQKSALIQAAFLVGWALGGGFFGRLGDRLGRSRALSLTILTYALFTGLSCLAQTWWQLLIFRFLAALGIGGEWAVGAALLSETWPRQWRPWLAAVLQTAVNLGILAACLVVYAAAGLAPWLQSVWEASGIGPGVLVYPRAIFLVGVVPGLLVFWIRRRVPEPEEWHAARRQPATAPPGIAELFRGPIARVTLLTLSVCACSLTAWWAFLFWYPQHLRNLLLGAGWAAAATEQRVTLMFFFVIGVSVLGNFFAGALARRLGYRRAVSLLCLGFCAAMLGTFGVERGPESLVRWIPWVGFFSGVFSLFTMYLPPLFPTLLRTTGAGFCFNFGRLAAAAGTVVFGLLSQVGSFRLALLYAACLLLPAAALAWRMPELRPED
jgi:MFS family permease